MWNNRKSSTLSLFLCYLFAVMMVIGGIALFPLVYWLSNEYYLEYNINLLYKTLVSSYCICVIFAETALFYLVKLLKAIRGNEVFTLSNVSYLRNISLCFAADTAVVSFFAVVFAYFELYTFTMAYAAIAICGFFLFLILRVIKNVFVAANAIKSENDMTI